VPDNCEDSLRSSKKLDTDFTDYTDCLEWLRPALSRTGQA
jgi:hypothetical protein